MRWEFDDEDSIKRNKNKTKDCSVTAFTVIAFVVFFIFIIIAEFAKITIWYKTNFD